MSTLEQQLLEFWTADAAVWRQMQGRGSPLADDDVLAGGNETRLYESWDERKTRRAKEREANIKAEKEKLKLVKYAKLRPPAVSNSKTRGGRAAALAREEARRTGATTYQGQPCKRGHSGIRRVEQSDCVECGKLRAVLHRKTKAA